MFIYTVDPTSKYLNGLKAGDADAIAIAANS